VEIKVLTVKKGLLSRLLRRPDECDVVMTKTAVILDEAMKKGALQPYSSKLLDQNIFPEFREKNRHYLITSFRARAIFYSKERVNSASLEGYADLADPKWKGRVAIRSGFHNYNLSLFGQLAEDRGWPWTEKLLKGLRDNLSAAPQGNDRAQAKMIHDGKADLAVANSYYMGIMLSNPEQKAWGEACGVFFPDQKGNGTHVIRSGAALTSSQRNVKAATAFLEFLSTPLAQRYFSKVLNAYAVDETQDYSDVNMTLGQPGIVGGRFKKKVIAIDRAESHRPKLLQTLESIEFDQGPQK
jgi:iron(III) transport system substrate-binding protein